MAAHSIIRRDEHHRSGAVGHQRQGRRTPDIRSPGSQVHENLHVYCNGWIGDEYAPAGNAYLASPEEYADRAAEVVGMGYDALKFDPFSAPRGSGWGPRERLMEPARGELAYQRVRAVREAVGPDVEVLVEVHRYLSVMDAIAWGRRIVPLRPFSMRSQLTR